MITILISYDLRVKTQNYSNLYEELKKANSWWHYLESTWIIETDETLEYWVDKICSIIDKSDSFIAIEISSGKSNGWLPQSAWDWIRNSNGIS